MKKLKVMIASMLGAIALVFACLFGGDVLADTDYSYSACFTGLGETLTSSSTGTGKTLYDAGWRMSVTNGNTTIEGETYAKIKPAGYIQSPDLVDSNNKTLTKTVNVTIDVATIDSKSVYTFKLYGYDSSDAVVATADGVTGSDKAFATNNLTLTSTTNDIKYVKFVGTLSGTSAKNGSVKNFNISFTVIDTNVPRVNFIVDGDVYASKTISNGAIEMPSAPTKDGCTFNGWYDENGNAFANESLTSSMSVYADFTRDSLVTSAGEATLTGINATTENTNADTEINSNITVKATADKTVEFGNSKKTAEDNVEVADYVKLKGDGSTTYRSIEISITKKSRVVVYMVSADKSKTASYELSKSNGDSVATGTLAATATVSAKTFTLDAGTYYVYGKKADTDEATVNVFGVSIADAYYEPCVSLSVDANNNNTKVRITAAIDNVDISTGKVSGIESMKYTIEGNSTWFKEVKDVYTSVDNASSGFYRVKDYTVYAIIVFSGYNNVTADFDVTFTVTLAGGQTVTKTITVVAPSA